MKDKSKKNEFTCILDNFLNEIDSLNDTLPMVLETLQLRDQKIEKDLDDFINKNRIKKELTKVQDSSQPPENEEVIIAIDIGGYIVFEELQKNAEISNLAHKVIPRSLFVCLISQFDAYFSQLVKKIFDLYPEKLNTSEKSLTYSQLVEFKNIEQIKDFIIEKEIESVLRENHTYHFDWLEKKLSMPLRKDLLIWPKFIEITERRNLFVHSDGMVSNQYLEVCKRSNIKIDKKIKIGDILLVSPKYFQEAYECLYELSVKLCHVIWRKLIPEDLENADEELNSICYDLIQNDRFSLADILLEFATDVLPKHFNEQTLNVFLINKALSKYLNGKIKDSNAILNQKDWSACNNTFKLAVKVLKEEYEEAFELMKIIGTSEIPRHAYQTWPLFRKIRETTEFSKTYKRIFKKDYKIIERPSKLTLKLIDKKGK